VKLTKEQGQELLGFARDTVRARLGGPKPRRPEGAWCERPAATFVTLRWTADGELQGCIGSLEAHRSLVDDVEHNAISAAFEDPRTQPLARLEDVDRVTFDLSVLSPLEPITFSDEQSALEALRPGRDGVVFSSLGRRSTLLPSMWPRLETPQAFLATLKRKAGLSVRHWSDDVKLWRYTVDEHELEHGASA
jgi:AmmeMemoRadiSam system protein A